MFPSVTTVLAPFGGIEELKRRFPAVIERAAVRGTAVHGYCEDAAKGLILAIREREIPALSIDYQWR